MTKLLAIRESEWTNDKGEKVVTYWLTLSLEGSPKDIPSYDVRAKSFEVGKDIPEGWEVKQSKAGKDYLAAPKTQGGGGGKRDYVPRFGDTEPGFAALQERMDRRTALMQAVQQNTSLSRDALLALAGDMYDWLRATSGSGVPPSHAGSKTDPSTTSPSVPESAMSAPAPTAASAGTEAAESGSGGEAGVAMGKGTDSPPDPGLHPHEPQWIDSPTVRNMQMCAVPQCSLHPSRRKAAEVPT